MTHPFVLLAAFALTGLSFSATAWADPAGQDQRIVRHSDLDLSTPEGAQALDRRIEAAANAVCLDATGPSPAGHVDTACKAQALEDARRQLGRAA